MGDDRTTPRKRRSRAELRELMITAGVEVLEAHGVELQISSVSYARVFEHLETSVGVRVTYGSIHERIWDSLQDYQLSVIERAGVWGLPAATADDAASWNEWAQTALALTSGPADSPVTEAALQGAQRTYAARDAEFAATAHATDAAGRRPRPDLIGLGHGDPVEILGRISGALSDGLQLRRRLTGDPATDGDLHDLVMWAVSRVLLGDDPAGG